MPKPPAGRLSLALAVFLAELTGAPVLEAGHGAEVKKKLSEHRKKAAAPVAGSADLPTALDPASPVTTPLRSRGAKTTGTGVVTDASPPAPDEPASNPG